ncbi:MAG: type II toxin-antitoxin system PemK/MazF family toxin [Deltaproteobacteria bacterium]|nr:type II toxin-antitoxin system PemK/MazF family toxin [Deltaproteobacteria bacterium]
MFLITLDPTIGHEIRKTRPCVVISPDEINKNIQTVIIAPMTTKSHDYQTRVKVKFQGKNGLIILDRIRTVDKRRLVKRLGRINRSEMEKVKHAVKEMLVD